MSKIALKSKYFLEELPEDYHIKFLAQEKNVFHGSDETEWIGKALYFQIVRIGNLADLKTRYSEHNIYRSWMVYDENEREIGRMPAYLDIDGHYRDPDLTKAHEATNWVIDTIKQFCALKDDDFRVVFSGQKGFHVEIRRPGECSKELASLLKSDNGYNTHFGHSSSGGTVLDKQHDYLRLHGTINTTDQDTPPRRCFVMTVDEFRNSDVSMMLEESEKK